MPEPRLPIIVVDDIRSNLLFINKCLKSEGYTHTIPCQDSARVLELLSKHPAEIILLDLRMPDPDGITLLPVIRKAYPDLPVIIVTDISREVQKRPDLPP